MTTPFFSDGTKDEFHPDNWQSGTSSKLPDRHPETGLDVLIVGAGPAGLMTALECWRKGHNIVGILERSDAPVYTG